MIPYVSGSLTRVWHLAWHKRRGEVTTNVVSGLTAVVVVVTSCVDLLCCCPVAAPGAMRWLLACAAVLAAGELGDPGGSEEKRDAVLPFTAGGAILPVRAARPRRYLLYDVNPGEGFNLRRDVYMRVAALLQKLVKAEPWVLVLPPWGRLYHWQSRSLTQQQQQRIPWSAFFNAPSLAAHVPVIEYEEYLKENGGPFIEQVFYLQSYAEGWTEGKWEEKVDVRPCVEKPVYRLDEHGYYRGWFWGYPETRAKNVTCLSVQGMASIMVPVLLRNTSSRSVMLDRAENLLHDEYGQKAYWDARRSMVFARPLRAHADEFRAQHLNSTDATDKTVFQEDWKKTRVKVGTAVGGPYLAAHLRRKDFLYGHSGDVPSLKASASTLRRLMQQLKLPRVFIATDADRDEVRELQALLPEMVRFEPSQGELHRFLDGGVAIIDQWICAHARHFIGTSVSTFSFRIHEEREILGFDPRSTYNRFCGDAEDNCEQPTRWKIVY